MQGLLCYCRAGFEPELAAELTERAAEAGHAGYARTERNSGHALFLCEEADALSRALPFADLIFARQKLVLIAELRDLDPKDRIAPMLDALQMRRFGTLVVEHPDSDDAKPLAGLARSFGNALRPALRKAGLLSAQDDARMPRLHVCFVDGDHAFLATSDPRDSSPWPMGVPRLKMHADAPSRSALKLEEAILTLLTADERTQLLREGMRAADLGAAPGGWTWVLTRHKLQVTAIDNGPLRPHVMDTGLVQHLRADVSPGIRRNRWTGWSATWSNSPRASPAAWPNGSARLVPARDLQPEAADEEALAGNPALLDRFAAQAGKPLTIRAKQLYHDREEITVFATPSGR